MLTKYQLMIANLYDISVDNVKKLVPNFFDKEKYALHSGNLQLCLRLKLKLKITHRILKFNRLQWLKPYVKFNMKIGTEEEKNGEKDGKALYKLMNNVVHDKTMENSRSTIDVRLVSNEKDYLKWTLYLTKNICK